MLIFLHNLYCWEGKIAWLWLQPVTTTLLESLTSQDCCGLTRGFNTAATEKKINSNPAKNSAQPFSHSSLSCTLLALPQATDAVLLK